MAKRTVHKESQIEEKYLNDTVLWRATGIAGVALALFLTVASWLWPKIFPQESSFSRAVLAGLSLFLIWLVVTGVVRTIHKIRPKIELWRLYLGGVVTALSGVILKEVIWSGVQYLKGGSESVAFSFTSLLFFMGVALVASTVALIHLRIRNRRLGQVLEVGLIALIMFLFFQVMR